jgi:hypothetical protein
MRHLGSVRLAALLMVLYSMVACGGYGNNSSNTPSSGQIGGTVGGGAVTMAAVHFSDSPSDRVVSFELTISSITLTASDGSTATLLSTPRRVEVTHVSGTSEPLALLFIPQGTYVSAKVIVSAPDVVFIDNSGHEVEKEDGTLTKTITIPLNPSLVVGATPVVLTFDFDARASITIDPVSGNVTVNPLANLLRNNISELQQEQDVENGEFEHVVGQVASSTANSLSITTSAGVSLTFSTTSATSFENVAGAAALEMNSLVRVEGRTLTDGTLLAKEVEVLSANGMEAEGLITRTTGNPVTSLAMVVQDLGGGMTANNLGSTLTVNISNRTRFRVDNGKVDLSGLNLPTFSASTLSRGQRIEAESGASVSNNAINAESIKLQQQALVGAASAVNGSQFTLTVPDDSAFKLLTGQNTLRVTSPSSTELRNGATITAGTIVKVRGLVFFEPAHGWFTMVAGRISTP